VSDHLWGVLRAHPGATATELATAARLSRAVSFGAVANVLEALVEQDTATRTSDKPKRYRLNGDDETAHDGVGPKRDRVALDGRAPPVPTRICSMQITAVGVEPL